MKNTIRIQRAKHDMTQEELAKRLQVSRQTINAIENNKYFPSLELGLKLSEIFGCPVNELFQLD
jgi:putative transcriptional regulator